jgi:FkbM family methyltransferase
MKIVQKLRHWMLRCCDVFLLPICPKRFRLALRYNVSAILGQLEREARHVSKFGSADGIAVDVGANWGAYAYPMAKHFREVIAFEPNSDLTELLAGARLSNVTIAHKALSATEGMLTLRIPVVRGQSLTGWGTLQSESPLAAERYDEKMVEVATLDSYAIRNVAFVKIDAEGHELEVLQGARQTLLTSKPVCLVEARRENLPTITKFFRQIDPHYILREDADVSDGNYIFSINTNPQIT